MFRWARMYRTTGNVSVYWDRTIGRGMDVNGMGEDK